MIVADRPLPDVPIDALVVTDAAADQPVHEGETIGYRCEECGAGDETLKQIDHELECPLRGEQGELVDTDVPQWVEAEAAAPECNGAAPTPELQEEHPIEIVTAGWTDESEAVHHGEPILFRCGECGNADEELFAIRHDEDCALAGRYSTIAFTEAVSERVAKWEVRADGGE